MSGVLVSGLAARPMLHVLSTDGETHAQMNGSGVLCWQMIQCGLWTAIKENPREKLKLVHSFVSLSRLLPQLQTSITLSLLKLEHF